MSEPLRQNGESALWALAQMDDFVRTMHTTSHLIDVLDDGISLADAEQQAMDYVTSFVPDVRKAPMAGNSIATDRGFIARDMPLIDTHLHYRMVDVSSIKELARRWFPRAYFQAPAKTGGHRALGDIRDSIDELRYYRAAVFVAPPGPDTGTAKALAAQIAPAPTPATTQAAATERNDGDSAGTDTPG